MATLAEKLSRGDSAAFAELYDACADRVHHYLMVRLGRREDADDVLQETFVKLARSRRRLARVDNVVAYVFAAARNEALRLAMKRGREGECRRQLTAGELFELPASAGDGRAAAEAVADAIGELMPELREIVELKSLAGLTFAQVAYVLGLPQGTVATRYRTALAKMRRALERELP